MSQAKSREELHRAMSITDRERPYLPETIEDLIELSERLEAAGHSRAVVQGILGWLTLKVAGKRDPLGQATKARYRAILAELDGVGGSGPGGGADAHATRPRRSKANGRRQVGAAHLRTVAMVASGAGVAVAGAAGGPQAAALAAAAAAPIILDDEADEAARAGHARVTPLPGMAKIHTSCGEPGGALSTRCVEAA